MELVTAALETLVCASNRGTTTEKIFIVRSFLVNKLPSLLSIASSLSYEPLNATFLLSEAFMRFDPSIYSVFAQGFALNPGSSDLLAQSRKDLVLACSLHGFIPHAQVPQLLNADQSQTFSRPDKVQKDNLLKSAYADASKISGILDGMESMDGNAGSYAEALGEVRVALCMLSDSTDNWMFDVLDTPRILLIPRYTISEGRVPNLSSAGTCIRRSFPLQRVPVTARASVQTDRRMEI